MVVTSFNYVLLKFIYSAQMFLSFSQFYYTPAKRKLKDGLSIGLSVAIFLSYKHGDDEVERAL